MKASHAGCFRVLLAAGAGAAAIYAAALVQRASARAHGALAEAPSQEEVNRPFTLDAQTAVAMVLSFLVSGMASSAGVGGGAFFVPLFNLLLDFSIKMSTALSQAVIAAGAVGSVAYAATRGHPRDKHRWLIDYDLALTLTPVLLLGVMGGVLLNVVCPPWSITFLLILLLLYLSWRTLQAAVKLHRIERRQRLAAKMFALQETGMGAPGPLGHADGGAAGEPAGPDGHAHIASTSPAAADTPGDAAPLQRTSSRKIRAPERRGGYQPPAVSVGTPSSVAHTASLEEPRPLRMEVSMQHLGDHDAEATEAAGQQGGGTASEGATATGAAPAAEGGGSVDHRPGEQQQQAAEAGPTQAASAAPLTALAASRPGSVLSYSTAPSPRYASDAEPGSGRESAGISRCDTPFAGTYNEALHAQPATPSAPQGRERAFPWLKLVELALLWATFMGLQVGKSQFNRCSWQYGLLSGAQLLAALAANLVFVRQVLRERAGAPDDVERPILPDDYAQVDRTANWTRRRLVVVSAVTLLAGVVAGMLGIGGGMIMGPLMLELGVHPQVCSATSNVMVLVSASSAAASFALAGRLNLQYAAVFGSVCLVAAVLGVYVVGRIVKRSGRASIIVMILATIIGLGAVFTAVFAGRQAVEALIAGVDIGFAPFCTRG